MENRKAEIRNERFLWVKYEQEKQKLIKENLTPSEYEKRIHEIVEELGI